MKSIDKDTRFYIDIDLTTKEIVNLDYDNKYKMKQYLEAPLYRIFISKGQYNKLLEKWQ
jgi:hypothetical protein